RQLRPADPAPGRRRVRRPDPCRALGRVLAVVQPPPARDRAGRHRRHWSGDARQGAGPMNTPTPPAAGTRTPDASCPASFNPTARVLHWLMAPLVIAMLFIGVGMVASISARPWLIDLHRPLGIAILLLAVLRLCNRLRHRPPALPSTLPRW